MKKLMMLLLALLLLGSCAEAEVEPSPDLYLSVCREYDGDGVVALERTYGPDGRLLSETASDGTTEYTYRDGVTERRTFDADGALVEWLDTEYDEYGIETVLMTRDPSTGEEIARTEIVRSSTAGSTIEEHYRDGVLVYFCRHTSGEDELGPAVRSDYFEDGRTWYTMDYYDKDGNVTERQYHGQYDRFTEYLTYDRKGRLTELRITSSGIPSSRVLPRFKAFLSDGIEAKWLSELGGFTNTYDREGRLAERVHLDRDGERFMTTSFTYDSDGNLIREETVRANGTVEKTVEYVYTELPAADA